MLTVSSRPALEKALAPYRKPGKPLGFVPTMGALHAGHLSLVKAARRENAAVVASIFVNPLQFGPREDFKRYPRDLKKDAKLFAAAGVDVLYAPSEKTFYPRDFQTRVIPGELARPLCGASRAGHFEGVATVVAKLLQQVRPCAVYLGQKDYQQFKVIERMIRDLDFPVKARLCPIVREADGLAMSSRNAFLTPFQRAEAPKLHEALCAVRDRIRAGETDVKSLLRGATGALSEMKEARIDYLELRDADTLGPVVQLKLHSRVVVAAAVYLGRTRLIDNVLVGT